jgi:hypothetical protein
MLVFRTKLQQAHSAAGIPTLERFPFVFGDGRNARQDAPATIDFTAGDFDGVKLHPGHACGPIDDPEAGRRPNGSSDRVGDVAQDNRHPIVAVRNDCMLAHTSYFGTFPEQHQFSNAGRAFGCAYFN